MRNAYALLGLAFIIVFGSAYLLYEYAYAPTMTDTDVTHLPANNNTTMALTLTSPVFADGQSIPVKYTCDGDNTNPPLKISGVPEGTESLVLVMDDPDIPEEVKSSQGIDSFDHWVVYNIPADTTEIEEGAQVGTPGLNSTDAAAYTGPCPPPQHEPTEHRYIFRLYAVSGSLNFIKAPTLRDVEEAAKGMMLEKAELTGVYDRS